MLLKYYFVLFTRVRNHNSLIWPWKVRWIIRLITNLSLITIFKSFIVLVIVGNIVNMEVYNLDLFELWNFSIVARLVIGHTKFQLWWIVNCVTCVFDRDLWSFNFGLNPALDYIIANDELITNDLTWSPLRLIVDT